MRNARAWAAIATLAALVCFPALASVQQSPAASTLKKVGVDGTQRFATEAIVQAAGLQIGQPVTREDLQAAADRLGRLGLFRNVQYRYRTFADGVEVDFELEDAPLLPVYFDNFPWWSDAELTAALREAVVLFDGHAPAAGSIVNEITATLQQLLTSRGINAAVEQETLGQPDGSGDMLMFSVAGEGLKIASLQFEDPQAGEDQRVQFLGRELAGKAYSRFAIELFVIERARPLYLERGHLKVEFGTPQARFSGDPSKGLNEVVVVIPVQRGPRWQWGGVTWSGNRALGNAELDRLVDLVVNAPVNGMRVMGLWEKVKREYGRLGYLDAKVEPQATFDEAGPRVGYRVNITEGPRYKMGELVITGLSLVAERKIREAWSLAAGAQFDRTYFEEFLQSGVKRAFEGYVVHYQEIGQWLRTNPQTGVVDVLLDFRP